MLHTVNPRRRPDQIVYIVDHAEDRVMFFDMIFWRLIQAVAGRTRTLRRWVAMTDRAHMPLVEQATTEPNLLCYEELLAGTHDRYAWRRSCNGGLACPPAMIRKFRDADGMHVMHVWSMTEMSPICTVEAFKAQHSGQDDDGRLAVISTQGCTVCGEDIKIVGEDGADLPWGGQAWGALPVRGPWVIETNFKGECGDPLATDADGNGWFPTGDAAKITSERCLVITDRSKDVLKSGGEWIGSIDQENIAMAHLVVAMAACIATPHPKWGERPFWLS